MRSDAARVRRERERSPVVPGGVRGNAARRGFRSQRLHRIRRTAVLERADPLKVLAPLLALGPILWLFLGRPARTSGAARHPQGQRRPRRAPAPEPETERDASQRVVTDRRSAELDRLLEEWERGRRDEAAPES